MAAFLTQTWALVLKNLLIILLRKPIATLSRALLLPVIFVFVISYSKNWGFPAGGYGVGTATPVKSLSDAFSIAGHVRNKIVVADNGFKDGDIAQVVARLSSITTAHGRQFHLVENATAVHQLCPASILGVSSCFGAVIFHSSPDHGGRAKTWAYTLGGDESLGRGIDVNSGSNDDQVYTLPFQRAIDSAIATTHGGSPLPDDIMQYAYTQLTPAGIQAEQNRQFQDILRSYFAFAFFVSICGITYHLAGHMALEREKGMSQLIEAMMPNRRRWQPQFARLLSYHISFDLMYGPSWIIAGAIIHTYVFSDTNIGIIIAMHVLIGLSLASYSIFAGAFFRTAQLSGITVVLLSLVLAIGAQYGLATHAQTVVVIVTAVLFPPMTYMYFFFVLIGFQSQALPVNLIQAPPNTPWNVPGAVLLAIMAFQVFFFMILGIIVERWIHSPSQRGRNVTFDEHRKSPSAVRARSFSKYYYPASIWSRVFCCNYGRKNKIVRAVQDLSLDLTPGSITVLLGANGSGKSTTLNAIAGVSSITKGSIDIDGIGGLGLCPQKNVLWDELTVYEHVMIFDLLKNPVKTQAVDRHQLINACDLQAKVDAKAKTLSGGQKRKLQLSMMLVGGSRVCCVDEVSSGIDPLARRRIWDILLAERGHRSILLTTHFLDEADILSDYIAILSKGSLRAQGSSADLKHAFGSGYRIRVSEHLDRLPVSLFRLQHHRDGSGVIFRVEDSSTVASLIATLEEHGIANYQIEGPTIEEVFLQIADEMRDETPTVISDVPPKIEDEEYISLSSPMNSGVSMDMTPGRSINYPRQMWILLRKRLTILKSNYLPHITAIIVPLVAVGMVTLFFHGFRYPNGLPCDHQLVQSQKQTQVTRFYPYYFALGFVYGPANQVPYRALAKLLGSHGYVPHLGTHISHVHMVDNRHAFNSYVAKHQETLAFGGIFDSVKRPTFAWPSLGAGQSFYPAFLQNLVHNSIMDQTIHLRYESFQGQIPPGAGRTLQLVIYSGLALAVYPALMVLYPTIERLRNVRALHYSNGIRSSSLWSAYILFDLFFILLISIVAIALWAALWHGWYGIGYVFVVFVLFGLASAALSYCVSLFAWSQLSAFAFSAGYQCGIMMLYYGGYIITQAYAPADQIDHLLNIQYFAVAIIAPSCSVLRTLLLTLNEFSLVCRGTSKASYPGEITIYGGPILYLLIQFLLLTAFVIYWDEGGRFIRSTPPRENSVHSEEDVLETKRHAAVEDVTRLSPSNTGLRVSNISKSFGSNKAVDNISIGVRPSETFALLGPNGAGKSTLISLIRGDIRPSGHGGSVHIHDISLFHHRAAARNHLGTCPQFDAIDVMSVIEHLRFYARARGVSNVEKNVRVVMNAVGLGPYKDRSAWALSGGNKRKLSLAIALVGNPAVLILDEPSSGMDAAAKRNMWKILQSLSEGRVFVITTHSMEEADTLCQRAGIMAGRMLALGTTEDLRKQYSDACYVHLVHRDAPHPRQQDMDRMRHWVEHYMPQARIERREYGGQLRFSVKNGTPMLVSRVDSERPHAGPEQTTWRQCNTGALFQFLERNRDELGFSHYSVSAATLDQVFLSVVNQHNVEEENYAARRGQRRAKAGFWRLL